MAWRGQRDHPPVLLPVPAPKEAESPSSGATRHRQGARPLPQSRKQGGAGPERLRVTTFRGTEEMVGEKIAPRGAGQPGDSQVPSWLSQELSRSS